MAAAIRIIPVTKSPGFVAIVCAACPPRAAVSVPRELRAFAGNWRIILYITVSQQAFKFFQTRIALDEPFY